MEHKLITAAKQALECARCDHDLEERRAIRSRFRKLHCKKCGATFYEDKFRDVDGEGLNNG